MPHVYTDASEEIVDSYRRLHGNAEQTHVHVVTVGESAYASIAYDVDPREYEAVAGELVAYGPTREGVTERTERWLEQHPKGILGNEGAGGTGGFMSKIVGLIKRVDNYGMDLPQQQANQSAKEAKE